jgi:cadmium resistance protein CadD (predicted permease)
MCKEMPVIPVKQGGGPKKNNWKKWRGKEEERHKGSLTKNRRKKAKIRPIWSHSNISNAAKNCALYLPLFALQPVSVFLSFLNLISFFVYYRKFILRSSLKSMPM